MQHFPIRYMSKATGLSVDCIRAWERRYGAIQPDRSAGNRLYSEDQLHRLKLLKQALDAGCRIGHIARLPNEELVDLIEQNRQTVLETQPGSTPLGTNKIDTDSMVKEIVTMLADYRFKEVTQKLKLVAGLNDPASFVEDMVLPLLEEVGRSWQHDQLTVAQEHFISNFLRNIVGGFFNIIPIQGTKKILYATPEGHSHEFGLLAAALIGMVGGFEPIYLGAQVPFSDLIETANRITPYALVLAIYSLDGRKELLEDLKDLKLNLKPGIRLVLGGPPSKPLSEALESIHVPYLNNLGDLKENLFKR